MNGDQVSNDNPKIERFELNVIVNDIILDHKGSAYVIDDSKKLYRLNLHGWGYVKFNINNKVNVIKVLNEEADEGSHIVNKAIYIETDNGVYFLNGDQVSNDNPKIERFELNVIVNDIILDHKGGAYVIDNAGKKYHLNLHGWGYTEVND